MPIEGGFGVLPVDQFFARASATATTTTRPLNELDELDEPHE
jgi:prenyltransferase beta subunit